MEQDLEITRIEDLDRNTLYHVNLPDGTSPEVVKSFAKAASALDLKLFITIGNVLVERMCDVFAKLPNEQKQVIRQLLEPKERPVITEIAFDDYEKNGSEGQWEVNPAAHEQSK